MEVANGDRSPTAWKNPTCIFSPTSANDVSLAVKILAFTGSKYAIRSGGHSPLEGWASIDNGVLILMSEMKDLSYNTADQTVRFGFGNLWGDVYHYTETLGRLPVGGRVGTVGPMLTPGGGLSHMSNRYGFSVDNVASFDVGTHSKLKYAMLIFPRLCLLMEASLLLAHPPSPISSGL